jgi:hypothetical protein
MSEQNKARYVDGLTKLEQATRNEQRGAAYVFTADDKMT